MHDPPYEKQGLVLDELERMAEALVCLIRQARHDRNLMWQLYGCLQYTPAFKNAGSDMVGDGMVLPERMLIKLGELARSDSGEDSKLAVATLFQSFRRNEGVASPEEVAALLYLAGVRPGEKGAVMDVFAAPPRELPVQQPLLPHE